MLRSVLQKQPEERAANTKLVADQLQNINFLTLVGKIHTSRISGPDSVQDITMLSHLGRSITHQAEKRLLSAVCIQIKADVAEGLEWDDELLDTVQADQIAFCMELAVRYGGFVVGSLLDTITVYFGFPQKKENDARLAGRAALELMGQGKKRSSLLYQQHGLELDIRIGIHSGNAVIKPNTTPKGQVANLAKAVMNHASWNTVLVSQETKRLLEPFLEFEAVGPKRLSQRAEPILTYALKGEYTSEAFTFLRPWSIGRKMVGRDDELKTLVTLWEQVNAGTSAAVCIEGPAGIGKSKLLHEFQDLVSELHGTVKKVRCVPEQQNIALFPFLHLLKEEANLSAADTNQQRVRQLGYYLQRWCPEHEQLLPIVCSWLSIPYPTPSAHTTLAPDQQKQWLIDQLVEWLLQLNPRKPLLLIMEDLHWMDLASQELTRQLIQRSGEASLLLVQTTRPLFTPPWQEQLQAYIQLSPLDPIYTRKLILRLLEKYTADEGLIQYISDRADGVPLFVEELTLMLQKRNYLKVKNETYSLDTTQDLQKIPVRLKDLLSARLAPLGTAKETAQIAAAIGREFRYQTLLEVAWLDESILQADIQKLMEANLIIQRRRVDGDSYIFRHALIRDAAYDGMTVPKRKEVQLLLEKLARTNA
ncbi:MAG TPA: hypothetical protein DCR93_38195 [Cytophagales bacterium]|nr:hypothetical protein [Cytophagales bacterium]